MSCKIDRVISEESHLSFMISGLLTGDHVDLLRRILEQEIKPFIIDLTSVVLVDHEAVKLLTLNEADGCEIKNCPLYVREWMMRERRRSDEA